jgi:DNA-binding Lrp family transcriptional regulator
MPAVDDTDLKLLKLLHDDSRRTLRELGRELGLSISAVRKRVEKLERKGVIKKYTVAVDYRKLELGLTAFLNLEVDPKELGNLVRQLSHYREVCEIHRITGNHNLLVKVRSRDVNSLNRFLEKITNSSGSVRELETLLAIQSLEIH